MNVVNRAEDSADRTQHATAYSALVQHVELNKAGWWPEAIDRAILAQLFEAPGDLDIEGVARLVDLQLSTSVESSLIRGRIRKLVDEGRVIDSAGACKLSEKCRLEISADQINAENLEARLKQRFISILQSAGIPVDRGQLWEALLAKMILPMVRELGAGTYEVVTGKRISSIESTQSFKTFLEGYAEPDRESLATVINRFMDPSDQDLRTFLLGRLNYFFLLSAGNLDRRTLDQLTKVSTETTRLEVVLDTNVLFSILGLHENPSNAAAAAVIRLTEEIADRVQVILKVLPQTVQEAKAALKGARDSAPREGLSKSWARAGIEAGTSGLISKYLGAVSRGEATSSSSYFTPYIDGLELILEEYGVQIVQADLSNTLENRTFKRDVDDRYSFEYDKSNGKTRDNVRHDLLLWYFVGDERPRQTGGVLDTRVWLLTVDFGLINFDRKRAENRGIELRVVHPNGLMQLLRFWVPRSDVLEEALVGNLRIPFLFGSFDSKAERVTLEILRRASEVPQLGNLSPALNLKILQNRTLRDYVERASLKQDESGGQALTQAIESAVVEEATALEQQLETERQRNAELSRTLSQLESKSDKQAVRQQGALESKRVLQARIEGLEKDLARANRKQPRPQQVDPSAESEIAKLRQQVGDLERSNVDERATSVKLFCLWWLICALLICVLLVMIYSLWGSSWNSWFKFVYVYGGILCGLGVGVLISKVLGVEEIPVMSKAVKPLVVGTFGWLGAAVVALVVYLAKFPGGD